MERIRFDKALAVRDDPAIILYRDALGALSTDKAASQNAFSSELLHPKSMIICTLRAPSAVIGENCRDPMRGRQLRPLSTRAEGQCLQFGRSLPQSPRNFFNCSAA